MLLLAGCTQNELSDGQGEPLPEGKYPLTFTAIQGEPVASPQTRVSDYDDIIDGKHKSSWTAGDKIEVVVSEGGNAMETTCTLDANGNITNYNPPLYWKTTQTSKINAWYSNITGQATTSTTVSLADQSSGLAYVLKAEEVTNASYQSGNISLNFKHQLAKVRVSLTGTAENLTNATVGVWGYPSCTNNSGSVTGTGTQTYLPMHKVSYDNDQTYYYEANIVPGESLKDNAFEISVDGKAIKANLTSEITPQVGQVYTITLTVNGEKYEEIDVSSITEKEYTISSNVHLKGNGTSKNLKLIVNDGAKLILEGITLDPQTNGAAITCNGNATIILNEKNSVSGHGEAQGVLVTGGKTLVIKGNGELVASGAGAYSTNVGIGATGNSNITINSGTITAKSTGKGAGIGSAGEDRTCGVITINGGTIEARGGNYSAGIGGSNSGSCGDIIITGGNIRAYGGLQSPGIGNGDGASCGNITISGASTVVYAKKGSGQNPASIGGNNYNGKCGTVTIGAECTVTTE